MKSSKDNIYTLVALNPNKASKPGAVNENTFYFGHDVSSFGDTAIMHIDSYEDIFGVARNEARSGLKRLSVVKITYDECGRSRSIYRKYRPCYIDEMRGNIAVAYHSLLFLKTSSDDVLGCTVKVKKSNAIRFYFHHPDEIVHTSIILAVVSLFLGALSFILAIF